MIEYLEKLVDDQEYEKALAYAERLLLSQDNSPLDIVAINCALMTARIWMGENEAALGAGELAVETSRNAGAWDYFGVACMGLGVVHARLRQYDAAIDIWLAYLSKRSHYTAVGAKHEAQVWYNLGRAYMFIGDRIQGLTALNGALDAANRMADSRTAHGIRQALVESYLQAGQLAPIPRLFAKCGKYLRDHPLERDINDSRLWQLKLRAEYASESKRSARTISLALRGIKASHGRPLHLFGLHMLLARLFLNEGIVIEALGHSVAARVYARECRRYDCEAEAADLSYEVTSGHAVTAEEMDQYYLAEGDGGSGYD